MGMCLRMRQKYLCVSGILVAEFGRDNIILCYDFLNLNSRRHSPLLTKSTLYSLYSKCMKYSLFIIVITRTLFI